MAGRYTEYSKCVPATAETQQTGATNDRVRETVGAVVTQ